MRRREFITLLGGAAAAWPFAAGAEQPAMPVIGFLSGRSSAESQYLVAAFSKGLRETGFVEGRDFAIEFRWADGQYDRLPAQAADLAGRPVSLIVAVGALPAIRAAKRATATIPIVFVTGDDPVRLGLVASLNKPGGDVTGVSPLTNQLEAKRLAILHELIARNAVIAFLVNPNSPSAEIESKQAEAAAAALSRKLDVVKAATAGEIDAAFSIVAERGHGALLIGGDPFFASRRDQLVALAARHALPTSFSTRDYAEAGGLMSYGASIPEAYRQAGGLYAARILRGEKPGELPVMQATKLELVINLKAARALGLDIPPTLLALADEVIE
jgi:putative tryptophan/tyrosine transport system substrate-binding protein